MGLQTRLTRFTLVGAACFLVQWGIVHLLLRLVDLVDADAIAFAVSAQLNFCLNRGITWAHTREKGKQKFVSTWVCYNAVLVFTTTSNAFVFWLLAGLGQFSALVCATISSAIVSFVVNDRLVFRGKNHEMFASG
jgi:putative flippase GtrA